MYYVVDKYRILAESEVPVQMKDYPNCELVQGPPGVSLINFEMYEENGIKKVRSKEISKFDIEVSIPSLKEKEGLYEMKAGGESIDIKVKMVGTPYLPPLFNFPEGYGKSRIEVICTRGKVDKNVLERSGTIKWTPVDETVDVVIGFTALNFPPIQKFLRIRLK